MLVLIFGLLCGFSQRSFAGSGNPNSGKTGCLYNYTAFVTTQGSVADGSTNDIVTVTVTDAVTNAVVPGVQVQIEFTSGGDATPNTNSSGVATYGLANDNTNSLSFTVVVPNSCQPNTNLSFTYIPGPVNANPPPGSKNPSDYIPIISTAVANGSDTAVVQVHATDGVNNELPGTGVQFTIVGGSGSAETSASFNGTSVAFNVPYSVPGGLGQNGSLDLPITSPNPGTVQVEVQVWNGTTWVQIGSPLTVTFVVPPPTNTPPTGSLNPSYYIAQIPTATANNTDTAVVRLHITDGTNNEPDGYKVEFVITSNTTGANATMTGTLGNTSTGTLTTVLGTNANGSIDVPITDPQSGSVMIAAFAWDPATSAYDIPFGTVTVNFVAAPPTNTPPTGSTNLSYYITVIPSVTADGSDTDVVQLHITDGTNNEPDGYKVQFVVTSNNPASTAAIMTGTGGTTATTTLTTVLATNANGSIDVPITDLTAGSVTIAAYAWDPVTNAYDISFGSQIVTFTAGPPVPGNPGGGGTGGTSPGGGGLPPVGGGTDPGGGDNTGPTSNSGYTVLFVRQNYQLANGSQQDSVIAYITDVNKNPVPGVSVTFFMQTTPTSGTISSGAQFVGSTTVSTDDSGMARIAMTSTTPGTVFVDATIVDPTSGNTVLIDGSYQVVVFDDKPDTSNPQTALTVIVYEALADGTSRTAVKAHVVDINGNAMADQPVTFSIDSGTAQIVTAQPVYTDANGDAIIYLTSTTPGYALVTATVDGLPIDYGSPARVYFAAINIYVPRVFTPNGDGVNDVLKPILVGIQTFQYFTVYNRWGNIIFQTTDPNQGWDGTFKGVSQPVETYLWIAAGIDENGKTIVQKGMTSLVR